MVHMKLKTALTVLMLSVLTTKVVAFELDVSVGTWKMNLEKSDFVSGPVPRPAGPNFTRIESVENGLRFIAQGVNSRNQKMYNEYTITFDGRDHWRDRPLADGKPDSEQNPGLVSGKRIDDHTLELTFKTEDGRVVMRSQLVVSSDGKTGAVTSTGFNLDGTMTTGTIYWDRQ
jgi:hypothetical protein